MPQQDMPPAVEKILGTGEVNILAPRFTLLEVRDKAQPEGDTLGLVWVTRTEAHYDDEVPSFIAASLNLSYRQVQPESPAFAPASGEDGHFAAHYFAATKTVAMDATGLFLDLENLKGQNIGTCLLNEIVQWAKKWHGATFKSIPLIGGDNRRDRFLMQFGFSVVAQNGLAHTKPVAVEDLHTVDVWRSNITAHEHDAVFKILRGK